MLTFVNSLLSHGYMFCSHFYILWTYSGYVTYGTYGYDEVYIEYMMYKTICFRLRSTYFHVPIKAPLFFLLLFYIFDDTSFYTVLKVKVSQSYLAPCDTMDSPWNSSGQNTEVGKNIYFCFIDNTKVFDCGSQQTVENSSRDGNTRPPYLPSEKSVCRSRSNS